MPVIYSTHGLHARATAMLNPVGELRIASALDAGTLAREGTQADVVIVRAPLPEALFADAPRLRAAIRHGAGLDMIPVEAAIGSPVRGSFVYMTECTPTRILPARTRSATRGSGACCAAARQANVAVNATARSSFFMYASRVPERTAMHRARATLRAGRGMAWPFRVRCACGHSKSWVRQTTPFGNP